MTEADWLAAKSPGAIAQLLLTAQPRRLHGLTAAFLRRAWDALPTNLTRDAVEATERFARGCIGPRELARVRAADATETLHPLWLSLAPARRYAEFVGCCGECPNCEGVVTAYENQLARFGPYMRSARAGVEYPHWIAAKAAIYTRTLIAARSGCDVSRTVGEEEQEAQLALVRDILGGPEPASWFDWNWRTRTVHVLACGIYEDRAFDRMPILADALQDAGCDCDVILNHCRNAGPHARGCWVISLVMGLR